MKECCKDLEKRVDKSDPARPDLVVSVCGTCGCRHFELTVDPLVIGMKGAPLG